MNRKIFCKKYTTSIFKNKNLSANIILACNELYHMFIIAFE